MTLKRSQSFEGLNGMYPKEKDGLRTMEITDEAVTRLRAMAEKARPQWSGFGVSFDNALSEEVSRGYTSVMALAFMPGNRRLSAGSDGTLWIEMGSITVAVIEREISFVRFWEMFTQYSEVEDPASFGDIVYSLWERTKPVTFEANS